MSMRRMIYDELLKWKKSGTRKPLLLEGVRQCGKTYILKKFGEENYDDVAYFTFEDNPELSDVFRNNLDTKRITDRLGFMRAKKIEPEKTLLILDEIQLCGRALTSLKFFCENAPEYHVACAGSLLGVMLSKADSFPVGKVDRLKMFPMNFKEFLLAGSEDLLVEYIDNEDNISTEVLSEPVVTKLNTYLDYFFLIGGMPAAVASWNAERDIEKIDAILDAIIKDYRDDIANHSSENISKLTLIWGSIPIQLAKENNKFIFSHVKTGSRSRDLEDALEWLVNAGLVYKVKKVDPPEVPLSMFADNTSFKVYMADIGVLRRMAGMPPNFAFSKDKEYDRFRGAIMENFVLNEIVSSTKEIPYYWRSGSNAEIDFVAQINGRMVPIEAKAGNNKTKSLTEFIKKYDPKVAIITSERITGSSVVTYIPRYAVWSIADRLQRMQNNNGDR
ncbi:MAG: ATP-binding protein [Methanomassiliicoccaceae archaeon]|nr:ATP-binding protein [Methanomassiliicoccaceae archaeon]